MAFGKKQRGRGTYSDMSLLVNTNGTAGSSSDSVIGYYANDG